MPRKNFKNIGELQGYEYLKGVVTAIDSDLDTCTLTIGEGEDKTEYASVPIYYHCSDDAVELENGAIEEGSSGFAVDNKVLVLKQRENLDDKIFVIGHVDGARPCFLRLVFSTQSGGEAIIWDILKDKAIGSKTTLDGISERVEAIPTGSETQDLTGLIPPYYSGDCIQNVPNFFGGGISVPCEHNERTYWDNTTAPPLPMMRINGLVFKRAAPAPLSSGWYNGDWIDFSTVAGSDVVTYVGHSSRYDFGLVDISYITIPEPDVMITEEWRMEVYQWGGNLRYFLKGKNTGKQFQSGRPWISVTPLSSIEDATAEQFNLFYNELAEKEEPCAPFIMRMMSVNTGYGYGMEDGTDIWASKFTEATGIAWPIAGSGDTFEQVNRATYYYNRLFGPNFTDLSIIWEDIFDVAFEKIWDMWDDPVFTEQVPNGWQSAEMIPVFLGSDSNLWMATGIAEKELQPLTNIQLVFDAFSVCSNVNLATNECDTYDECVDDNPCDFKSDFHIFYHYDHEHYFSQLERLIFDKINVERVNVGVDALVLNPNLQKAAKRHSLDTATNQIEGHTGSDGSGYIDRIDDSGYLLYVNKQFQGTGGGGTENFGKAVVAEGANPEYIATEMVAAWMASPEHRINLLWEYHTETGISCDRDVDGSYYIVQTFGHVQDRWPGFGPFDPANLKAFVKDNFTWEHVDDKTRIPRIFLK